jgi:hypothetical protein
MQVQMTVGAAMLLLAFVAAAQKPVVYPAKGQSAEQQSKDDGECYVWAKQNTGIDPASASPPSPAASNQPAAPRGGVARGALAGAAVGAIGGNDVGNAAAKGAVIGGVAQRSRRRGQEEAQAQQAQQAQGQQQQDINTYYRAYSACMSGRGYTVSE